LHDDAVADRIAELGERVDGAALRRAWQESRAAAPAASRCWTHGDLLPGNLLAVDGRLAGVIDLGSLNATDPALDLTPCWYLLGGTGSAASRRCPGLLGAAPPHYTGTPPGTGPLAAPALPHSTAQARSPPRRATRPRR